MADFGGDIWGTILGGIGKLFGFFGGISKAIKAALSAIALSLADLGKATKFVFQQVGFLFKDTAQFFARAFKSIFPPLLKHINDWVLKLSKRLVKWFEPLVKWIQKKRKWLLDFWRHHVQPVLDVVDVVRRVLRIAGKLHVPGATSIEKRIASVENRVTSVFHDVVAKINEVLGWINRIVTVDGVLQEVILLTSIEHWQKDILGLHAKAVTRPMTAAEKEEYDAEVPLTTSEPYTDGLVKAMTGESSRVETIGREWADDVLLRISRAT